MTRRHVPAAVTALACRLGWHHFETATYAHEEIINDHTVLRLISLRRCTRCGGHA